MKTSFAVLGLMALSFAAVNSAHAETQLGDFTFTGNAGIVSDYVFRGISQSDEKPAVQGGFDVTHTSGLYAGVWGSNVDFNDGDEANVELDLYAGYSNEYEGFTYDLGMIYYAYPGADDGLDYDFAEAAFALGYDFDIAALSGAINYSPDFFGTADQAVYYATALDIPLPYDIGFTAHAGYQDLDDGVDYTDWSLGLGYNLAGFDLSVTYYDTDLDEPSECADGCGARIVAGISRSF